MNNYGESRNDKQVRERFQKLETRVKMIEDAINKLEIDQMADGTIYIRPKEVSLEEISHD